MRTPIIASLNALGKRRNGAPGLALAAALLAGVSSHAYAGQSGSSAEPPGTTTEKSLFEDMPVVEAATLQVQSLQEAPANVSVITAKDIRKYGYRTLGEALASVRGFYVTYDRIYHYVGVAGFSVPGDYNTRFLVLLNGHSLTENIYNSNGFFGQDFGLDMDLVERIEIIRGSSSALYGSNGILATINVVTRSPVDQSRFRASTETGSFGEKKILTSASMYLGRGANLLVSASVFHNAGQNLFFPEFNAPSANLGRAIGVDGERGYHTFANLVWHDWNLTGYFNSREKKPPMAWSDSIFEDTGSRVRDSRNFAAVTYTHTIGLGRELRWQAYYDNYRYDDRFDYSVPNDAGIDDIRTRNRGDWVGSEVTYRLPVANLGPLTIGAQTTFELRNVQEGFRSSPDYQQLSYISRPDRSFALFAQQEWDVSRRWKAYLGARFDESFNFGHFISPRVAVVYEWSPKTVYKFVYGRPYRNPSTFERYYDDGGYSSIANRSLRHETAHTFEMSAERTLRRELTATVSIYHYEISDLIAAILLPGNVQQYQNSARDQSTGVEFELAGKLWRRIETSASTSFDTTRNTGIQHWLPNSPHQVGKLRFAGPFLRNKLTLSSSTQFLGERRTLSGGVMRPVLVEDITLTTNRLHSNFDIQCGLRNALNWRYEDPVYLAIDQMRQDGRSFFVKLVWRVKE